MPGFEENEISLKANGGTEISKRSIAKFIPEELAKEFQIIPSRVREIEENKIRIYWQHDTATDPEVVHLKDVNSRNRFHKFVFVSNWQLNDFNVKLGFPLNENSIVIENPVEPIPFVSKNFDDKIRLIYFSTPQRGLELLVPVVEELSKKHSNIHLDVFSSFQIYGWDDADKQFGALYKRISDHPNMTYHGYANQEVVREHLQRAHILAYPSIWLETSCRVLIESMSAGLMCVHPNLAALPDTSGGLTSMYQFNEDPNRHANVFYEYLDHAVSIVSSEQAQNYLKFVKAYADTRFNLEKISGQWKNFMETALNEFPTETSRNPPSKMFIYKTSRT
jgi:UDP-glucose:(glucosyl)LPS alpha-1,2-glucosyltransferase